MNKVPIKTISGISAILPTFNRAAALRENLASFLKLEGIAELIVVDDYSGDDTEAYLASVDNTLLRVIRHSKNCGSPKARATGIAAASCPWILMLEDDCLLPADYGRVLLDVAEQTHASIVGAPWIHTSGESLSSAVRRGRAEAVSHIGLMTHPSTFPVSDIETPFLPALALLRRELFETLNYDRGYRGNAWREETSLFIAAAESGRRCVLTPRTFSYQVQHWGGGQRRQRLVYEGWVIYNNWRFLRRHEAFLQSGAQIHSARRAQWSFIFSRFGALSLVHLRSLKKSMQ